jgi:hypothetical protein
MAKPNTNVTAGRRELEDALEKLNDIPLRVPPQYRAQLRAAVERAVRIYYKTPNASWYAKAIREAFSQKAISVPPEADYHLRPGATAHERIVLGQVRKYVGGRTRIVTHLAGQTTRGFPGRVPEAVLVSLLAAAWVKCGGTVSRGWDDDLSPFEQLVDGVFVALLIDDVVHTSNLVRIHIEERDTISPPAKSHE